ncbi:MAG: hypothetical protein JRH19_27345, partial [Deltaproteobacteria bacterium]|nr:hypothetical protein [Deltaproteobacteria bacterium]
MVSRGRRSWSGRIVSPLVEVGAIVVTGRGRYRRGGGPLGVFLAVVLVLGACSSQPKVMRLEHPKGTLGQSRITWPPPPAPPRFVYAGELTGEANFAGAEADERSGAVRALSWLVGLGQERRKPVVLQRPQGGAVDDAGRVYVTDVSRQAVFVFDEYQGRLHVWEMATKSARFVAPIGIAIGANGEVLVSDAELALVARLGPDGTPVGTIGAGLLQRPTGIARDPERGRIYVADTRANDIKVFDESGELLDTLGHEGNSPGALNAPTYLAFSRGRIYVSDTLNSRIQIFDREGNLVGHFGKRGLYLGNLSRPKGVSVGPGGEVYVIESYYDHLLAFDSDGRFLLPIGGTGSGPGQFYLPAGVWTDARGRVYVA